MKTLLELITYTPPYLELKDLFIVITEQQKNLIESAQSQSLNMKVSPVPLVNGKFAICADLLSEIHEGGIFYRSFSNLSLESINETEIVDKETFLSLLPADPA